jgi:hypothetical protein
MPKPTPGEILRAQLEHKRRTLPMFLRPQLGDVLAALDDWIAATETRLSDLDARVQRADKMPAAADLDRLVSA